MNIKKDTVLKIVGAAFSIGGVVVSLLTKDSEIEKTAEKAAEILEKKQSLKKD